MSTQADSVAPTTVSTTPADLRTRTRWFLAVLLPVGPACVAVLRYVLPYSTGGDSSETVQLATGAEATMSLVLWLAFVAILTLVPGVLAVGRLTRRRAPKTTAAALVLVVPGYLCLTWLVSADIMLWAGAHVGMEQDALVRLYNASHPTTMLAGGVFVLGHVLGTILLGVALWRSRTVPRWAAVVTIIAQPLHFTAAVVLASPSLDLFAWGLNALGFAVAAVAITRLRDDEWDLGPRRAGTSISP